MATQIDWAKRGESKEHPLRKRILAIMLDGKAISPNMLAQQLDEPLGNVSYHVAILFKDEMVVFVKGVPRRGAMEHFYRLSKAAICYTDEDGPAESSQAGS